MPFDLISSSTLSGSYWWCFLGHTQPFCLPISQWTWRYSGQVSSTPGALMLFNYLSNLSPGNRGTFYSTWCHTAIARRLCLHVSARNSTHNREREVEKHKCKSQRFIYLTKELKQHRIRETRRKERWAWSPTYKENYSFQFNSVLLI